MKLKTLLNATVIVSALGYFVDIYDLLLFSIVRVSSLKGIHVPENRILDVGVLLLNMQMGGMLIGGVLWGLIGDKKGRLSVLFGSIALYSLANILNAFVTSVPEYAFLRFLAGVGLAGELGAAITLVSEILPKELRGYGTTIVASVGICGAILASTVGDLFTWKTCYLVGGGLGLALLLLRIGTIESFMFHETRSHKNVRRGDLRMLFTNLDRIKRYAYSILIGVPFWYVVGILITFSPEITRELGATGPISAGRAVLFQYLGLTFGDLASGLISQWWRSRRKVIFLFITLSVAVVIVFCTWHGFSPTAFYGLCICMGFAAGYWAVFVSAAAEQFGTNLRATVTTTAPNFVRGATVPLTLAFKSLSTSGGFTLVQSASILGVICFAIAYFAAFRLPETFGRDLNFVEE
jgi:MFS transporter, putative metabolite:H+ symporter